MTTTTTHYLQDTNTGARTACDGEGAATRVLTDVTCPWCVATLPLVHYAADGDHVYAHGADASPRCDYVSRTTGVYADTAHVHTACGLDATGGTHDIATTDVRRELTCPECVAIHPRGKRGRGVTVAALAAMLREHGHTSTFDPTGGGCWALTVPVDSGTLAITDGAGPFAESDWSDVRGLTGTWFVMGYDDVGEPLGDGFFRTEYALSMVEAVVRLAAMDSDTRALEARSIVALRALDVWRGYPESPADFGGRVHFTTGDGAVCGADAVVTDTVVYNVTCLTCVGSEEWHAYAHPEDAPVHLSDDGLPVPVCGDDRPGRLSGDPHAVTCELCRDTVAFDEAITDALHPDDVGTGLVCAECGTTTATTYVVTILDREDPRNTRTEVCRSCDTELGGSPTELGGSPAVAPVVVIIVP